VHQLCAAGSVLLLRLAAFRKMCTFPSGREDEEDGLGAATSMWTSDFGIVIAMCSHEQIESSILPKLVYSHMFFHRLSTGRDVMI